MSDALGPMVYAENDGEVFLGRSITTHKNVSEATLQKVDAEIRRIIDEQYAVAYKIIDENRDKIEAMTKALLEWETLDSEQIGDIMAGKDPRPPADLGGSPKGDAGSPKKPSDKAVNPRLDAPAGEH
jgi:cell division protease FtsH